MEHLGKRQLPPAMPPIAAFIGASIPWCCNSRQIVKDSGPGFAATFRQRQSIGCNVMKGQKGTQITFSTPITKTTIDRKGEEQEEKFSILRAFTAFSSEQCPGAERFHVGDEPVSNDELDSRFDEAQRVVEATEAKIIHGGDRAF